MTELMQQKTTYKKLEEKYHGFVVPTIKVKAGGTQLPLNITDGIVSASLELSCIAAQMNVFSFTLSSLYNYKKQAFDMETIEKYFKLGNDIEVELGYIQTEPLFKGYIYETSYTLDINEGLTLTVTCKDFKGLLANKLGDTKRKGGNRIGEVKNILNYSGYKKYAKLKSPKYLTQLESTYQNKDPNKLKEEHDPLVTELEKINALAEEYGYEFFVLYDEVYFRPIFSDTGKNIMTISPDKGLLGADVSCSMAEMTETVEVRGYGEDELKVISGIAQKTVPPKVTTNTAALGYKVIYDEKITAEAEAKQKAKALLEDNKWQNAEINVRTIGIPDIVPGRTIKIEGLSKNIDKDVYIQHVSHQVSTSDGYTTSFTGRIDLYG